MAAPIALFASCSETSADHLIRKILPDDTIKGAPVIEDIMSFPWCIDTRYYTAEIQLCSSNSRTIGNAEFANRLEAFVVHFTTQQVDSFEKVKLWIPYLKEIDPEIRLLVCDTCATADAVSRETAWKWCLENNFELVELYPQIEEHSDEEDDFKETTGIQRIVQALHAHSWPNLIMKDKPSFRSSLMTQMMRDHVAEERTAQSEMNASGTPCNTVQPSETPSNHNTDIPNSHSNRELNSTCDLSDLQNPFLDGLTLRSDEEITAEGFKDNFEPNLTACENVSQSSHESSEEKEAGASGSAQKGVSNSESRPKPESKEKKDKSNIVDSMLDDQELQNISSLDVGQESFEGLFDQLKSMKEQAENLPFEQRKQYAEKVAIQFWKVIGGDEEEIDGLSSDEET